MGLLAEKKANNTPWRYLVEEVAIFLHSAFMRPDLEYTLSHFEPSSATKMWINCNKINGAPHYMIGTWALVQRREAAGA